MFISKVIKSIGGFLAVIIFSREAGASPLGTYYGFIAFIGILSIPTDLGIESAAEKRISEGKDRDTYLASAILLKSVIIIVPSVLLLLANNYINQYLGAELGYILVLILVIDQGAGLGMRVLRGELRVGETALIQTIHPLSWLTVGYYLYIQGYGVSALVYGHLFGTILTLVISWWKVETNVGYPSINACRSLFDYGKYSVVPSIGGTVYSWIDILILTLFLTEVGNITRGEIGAYENAWRLSLLALMISRSIETTIFPQFSQWDAEGATDRIEEVIPKAALPSLLVVIPAFAGTIVLSKDLLRVLFGSEFTVAWLVLIIFSGEKVIQSLYGVFARPLMAIDRPELSAYATITSIIVNIILNIVLIFEFGIIGAAAATTISFGLNTILHARYLNKFIKIDLPLFQAAWSAVVSLVMMLLVYITSSIIVINTIPDLIFVVLFGVIIYVIGILIYSPTRTAIWQMTKPIIGKFSSKVSVS
ncbi:membrane protein involved in the export of O-antigen and teichoic acid [Halorubrum kocurii JCM 14978]|uniref:Membrane protein involved in the export of O-antigen and teichoic acid n=2 Tax=Halorubrum kocurii TaxID=478441 RepID=M0PIZ4_9EURY|nr:membrane protein involved in the export of O-antigen and teichoic acid [Halorubrum kocurii JCM 14978]